MYKWATDCPLKIQSKSGSKAATTITLESDLTAEEVDELQGADGSRLNGTLPISLAFKQETIEVRIPKQGPGQKALNSKAEKIAEFVAGRIEIQYIPAVRTADSAQEIVDDLVQNVKMWCRMQNLKQAVADITALREPILKELSEKITETMREFLPNIIKANISIGSRPSPANMGVRKEDYVLPWLRRMTKRSAYGVYFIFKSMEQGPTFRVTVPKYPSQDPNHCILARQRSRFTHDYFYIRDEVLGPMAMRVATFFPFQTTYYLNGHKVFRIESNQAAIVERSANFGATHAAG